MENRSNNQIFNNLTNARKTRRKVISAIVCLAMLISVVIPIAGMFVDGANNVALGYNDEAQGTASYPALDYGNEYYSVPVVDTPTVEVEVDDEPIVDDNNIENNVESDDDSSTELDDGYSEYVDDQFDTENDEHDEEYENIAPMSATDLTGFVSVIDWDLVGSNGVSIFETSNSIAYGAMLAFRLQWSVDVAGGGVVQAGDYFRIYRPTIETQGNFTFVGSNWQSFTDENNVVIGHWRINDSHIEVEFNENAAGSANIGGNFETGLVIRNNTRLGGTRYVSFMSEECRPVNFLQFRPATVQVTLQAKRALSTSANRINWQMDVFRGDVLLGGRQWNAPGTYGTQFTNTRLIVEDVLSGEFVSADFTTRIAYPISITPGTPQYGFVTSTSALFPNFNSYMTKLTPNVGESYAAFLARVTTTAMQWGVWTSDVGVQTFVAYFGTLGVDNPLIPRVSSLNPNFAQQAADLSITQGIFAPGDRDALISYFNTMHGDGNVIHGRLSNIHINLTEQFPSVSTPTTRSNTMRLTRNGTVFTPSATGVQQPMGGGAVIVVGDNAEIRLIDEITSVPIGGGVFQLQTQGVDGTWTDMSGRIYTTNVEGYAVTGALSSGTFRFRQVSTPAPYHIPSSAGFVGEPVNGLFSSTFIINVNDATGPSVTVENIRRFVVTYILHNGDANQYEYVIHNQSPTNVPTGFTRPGYSFLGWGDTANATTFVDPASATISANRTFHAVWRVNPIVSYTVTGLAPATYTPSPDTLGGAYYIGETVTVAGNLTTTETTRVVGGVTEWGTWAFSGWTAPAGLTVTGGTFTMPGSDVEFTGVWTFTPNQMFEVTYNVTSEEPATFNPSVPVASSHQEGETGISVAPPLTTTETTRVVGGVTEWGVWTFNNWTTQDVGITGGAFTMPGNDVEFTGSWTFTPHGSFTVTYNVTSDEPATFNPSVPSASPHQEGETGISVAPTLTTTETTRVVGGVTEWGTWTFNGWTAPSNITVTGGTFTMPGSDVEFTGVWTFTPNQMFEVTYNVTSDEPATFNPTVPTVSLHQESETGISVAPPLTTTETTRVVGGVTEWGVWTFSGWTAPAGLTVTGGTFTMPGNDVEFTGSWTFAPNYQPVEYSNIRVYYYLMNSDGELERDMVHNANGRQYTVKVGDVFGYLYRVLDRNEYYNCDDYVFEGWRVTVGGEEHHIYDMDLTDLHGEFTVPAVSALLQPMLQDFVAYDESNTTIVLQAVWSTREAEESDSGKTGDDNQNKLPQTGIENNIVVWATLLALVLLAIVFTIIKIKKAETRKR